MELTRVILICVLFLLGFMLWNAWQNEHPSQPVAIQPKQAGLQFQPVSALKTATAPTAIPVVAAKSLQQGQRLIQVHTDTLDVTIDTLGGNIIQAKLLKYPQTLHSPQPYLLLSDDPSKLFVAQSGLVSNEGPDKIQGQAIYSATQPSYTFEPNQDQLNVNLRWQNNGVTVNKQFNFRRNDYVVGVNYQVDNRSTKPWSGQFYAQLERKKVPPPEHSFFGVNPYIGGAISTSEKPYQKISFEKMAEQNLNIPTTGGWAAFLEHYFLSAWVPQSSAALTYYSHASEGSLYTLGMLGNHSL